MANRPDTEIVSLEVLLRHWQDNAMPERIASGEFRRRIVPTGPAKNPRYAGGTTRIVILYRTDGRFIGSVHEIEMPDGTFPHSHPKMFVRDDGSRIRLPEANEPR